MRKALSIKTLLQVEISLSKCFYILLFYLKYPDLSARRKRDLKHGATIPVVGADRSLMQVDDLLSQGKANAAKYLEDNPEVGGAIEKIIREKLLVDSAARGAVETDETADLDA